MADFDLTGQLDGVTKAQNAEFFDTDILPINSFIFRLELSVSAAVVIEVTFDSGSNWTALNTGAVLSIDNLFVFDVYVKGGDAFNMRIPTSGGAIIDVGRVYQVN